MLCTCLKMPRESARYCSPEVPIDRRGLSEPGGPCALPCQCVDLFTLHTLTLEAEAGDPEGSCGGYRERNAFQAHGDMGTYMYIQFKISSHRHTHTKLFTV